MTKQAYTLEQKELYRQLLELNYSEPYIQVEEIENLTGLRRSRLMPILGDLIGKGKVLAGNEEVLGALIRTYTPIVKGGNAYGWPCDTYTFNEWMGFQL
tara:strand:- start:369 stop:665 length:297 start_codon:yes stop_codon:yes gene_type:complete